MILRTLWGSWAQKPLCAPPFLFAEKQASLSILTFPEFHRAESNNCESEKGRDVETKEKQSRNNSTALAKSPALTVPPKGYT